VSLSNASDPTSGVFEWKIVNNGNTAFSSGEVSTGTITGTGSVAVNYDAPDYTGTYYVKCRLLDSNYWVTSNAITVT